MRTLLALSLLITLVGCAGAGPSSTHMAGEPTTGDPTLEPTTTTSSGMATIVIPFGGGPYKIVFYEGHQCKACEKILPGSQHIGTFDPDGPRILFVPEAALAKTAPRARSGDVPSTPWEQAAALGSYGAPLPPYFVGPPLPPSEDEAP